MTTNLKYWIIILLSIVVVSCKVSQKTTAPRNLERIYDPASSSIHPNIKVYNISDTSSIIVERVYNKELLFNQANSENKLLARLKVIYNLYDINDKYKLVDSSTTTFNFEKNTDVLYHNLEIPVKTDIGANYILEVLTKDVNRNAVQYSFRKIDRTNKINLQDFILYNENSKEYRINSLVNEKSRLKIKHYKNEYDSLHIYFFANRFKTPKPPYINDTINDNFDIPDSNWVCYLDSIDYTNFRKEGIYYFTANKGTYNLSSGGLVLYNFGGGFPIVRSPEKLAKPIVYLDSTFVIPTKDSIGKLTKLAIDNFWLDKANNIDKSRELLKEYYSRVMFANLFFTSYKEGWQTDRGMIYIIYGLPDYLFKSGEEEKWIYNPEGIGAGISFTFKYIKTPLSLNHYLLDRDKLKVTGWNGAVDMWNKGEIIYFQN